MIGVHETDERQHCLELGKRHGLDIHTITKLLVTQAVSQSAGFSVDDTGSVVASDTQLNADTTDVSIPSS